MTIEAKLDEAIALLKIIAGQGKTAAPAATPAKAAEKPAAPKEEPAKGPTYDDVKVPFLALCKEKGEDAGRALLKELGVAKLPDVKPADFPKAIEAIEKARKAVSNGAALV